MEILTSVKRLYISFKSLVSDFVYSFGRAALLLLVEVQNHTVPVRERGRIRVKPDLSTKTDLFTCQIFKMIFFGQTPQMHLQVTYDMDCPTCFDSSGPSSGEFMCIAVMIVNMLNI